MFLVSQATGLVENFFIGIFSYIIDAINVKLCMMVLLVELYLFIPLSVTFTIFQEHSIVKRILTENFVFISDEVETL